VEQAYKISEDLAAVARSLGDNPSHILEVLELDDRRNMLAAEAVTLMTPTKLHSLDEL
jgi:hypothetical protein